MTKFELVLYKTKKIFRTFIKDLGSFVDFLFFYLKKKITKSFLGFEQKKNLLVKFFIMKRGRYNRPFLHFATLGVLGLGVAIAPFLADTYPLFSPSSALAHVPSPSNNEHSITADQNVFATQVSQKPRDKMIDYTVERGDTLSTIANKFGISTDTVRWTNDLTDDSLSVGDTLKIPPVTGIVHKVQSGDTVYTIAKRYNTDPQKIVDFPFNDFANPETFSLVDGQMLMVPDGIKPSEQSTIKRQPVYIAEAPQHIAVNGSGFSWPIQGEISQGFTWYHNGIDIAGPIGTPIYSTKAGTVVEATCGWNGGYGCHVLLSHADGYSSMYAHMNGSPAVSVGQSVGGGELIGYRGNTGRSTGPHTHFEIRSPGGNVNPLAFLH